VAILDQLFKGSVAPPFATRTLGMRRTPDMPYPSATARSTKLSGLRRYFFYWLISMAAIWLLVTGYLLLTPARYTSRWTLILPTAASNANIQLATIGQAQNVESSAFGSISLSPKVIYKEIFSSEKVRLAAAQSVGVTLKEFGSARIKLIDETALMMFELTGRTAAEAQHKANSLIGAFEAELDTLRRDEVSRRAEVVQDGLKGYQASLQSAREKVREQQRNGIFSENQFNDAASTLELIRRKITDVKADLARLSGEQKALSTELGIDAKEAASLLKLSADPSFAKTASEATDATVTYQVNAAQMAPENPLMAAKLKQLQTAQQGLEQLATAAGVEMPDSAKKLQLVSSGTHRSELIKNVVADQAATEGKTRELAALESEFKALTDEVQRMSRAAAQLDDLKKGQLVAEAVFSSALARLDTNKVDIFASYPMVQTLAVPDLPERKSSPSLLVGLLGGILASGLAFVAWGLAWLRLTFSQGR